MADSQTTLVTALVLERPLCMECITAKAALTETEVGVALARVQHILRVYMEHGRCRSCGTDGVVVIYSDRPA